MLPKVDKNKKTFPSDGTSTKPDYLSEKKRLKRKRRLILVSIIITVGLSFFFWTYRNLKSFFLEDRKISLRVNIPNLNLKIPNKNTNNFESEIKKIISQYPDISLYLSDNDSQKPFSWQYNQDSIFKNQDLLSIKKEIDILKTTPTSQLEINLPEGLTFQEIVKKDPPFYFVQINLPSKKLLILTSLDENQDIQKLIESLYWTYIQNSN